MSRTVTDLSLHWGQDRGLTKLSARIDGGETGSNFVEFDARLIEPKGELSMKSKGYNCSCHGFGRYFKCRHVKALMIIKNAIEYERNNIFGELNK